MSRGNSVSIASDYGLDDRGSIPYSPVAHPAACTAGAGGVFPRDKARQGRDADHTHLLPRLRKRRCYTFLPEAPQSRVAEDLYFKLFHTTYFK
jgi:hypothetical protein